MLHVLLELKYVMLTVPNIRPCPVSFSALHVRHSVSLLFKMCVVTLLFLQVKVNPCIAPMPCQACRATVAAQSSQQRVTRTHVFANQNTIAQFVMVCKGFTFILFTVLLH